MIQGQRGRATWFFPRGFVRHKAKMEVLPKGSLTELEIGHTGARLKDAAASIYGIRPDYTGGPGHFFKAEDIEMI